MLRSTLIALALGGALIAAGQFTLATIVARPAAPSAALVLAVGESADVRCPGGRLALTQSEEQGYTDATLHCTATGVVTPTVTVTPTLAPCLPVVVTATPEPSETPTDTPAPTATATADVVATAVASTLTALAPTATGTPRPTETPEPTPTVQRAWLPWLGYWWPVPPTPGRGR